MAAPQLDRAIASQTIMLGLVSEHLTRADPDPARLAAVLAARQQTFSSLKPGTSDRIVTAKHPQIGTDQGREFRRSPIPTPLCIQPVRHLASRQRRVHLPHPT